MLGVDEGHLAAPLLGLGHHVEGQSGLTGGLGAIDLNDTPLGHAADAQGDVQGQRAGGDGLHHHVGVLSQAHDGALAVIPFDLGNGGLQRLLLIRCRPHRVHGPFLICHASFFLSCRLVRLYGF